MDEKIRVYKNSDGSIKYSVISKKTKRVFGIEKNCDYCDICREDFPESDMDSDCWIFNEVEKKVKVCPIKKAEKEAKKLEKENKKNLLKSKLKLSDEEIEILKTLL